MLGLYACGTTNEVEPRVGEEGKVKFVGGGGCNSSTTLAAGSKITLTLEPLDGVTLSAKLAISSTDSSAIKATSAGTKGDKVLLEQTLEGVPGQD